jgi:hypothetical protein
MSLIPVFADVTLDSVPMERFAFAAATKRAVLTVDTNTHQRAKVIFKGVMGFRFTPTPLSYWITAPTDRPLARSILEDTDSAWIKELHSCQRRHHEAISHEVRHFLIPADDGLWEILAHSCSRRGDSTARS